MMPRIYADSIKMYDKDFILHGNTEISDFIDKLQQDPEFDFMASKPIEAVQMVCDFFGISKRVKVH